MSRVEERVGASSPRGDQDERREGAALGERPSVGRFSLLHLLGSGGMGVVHAAYDPELDRRVAVKLVRPSVVSSKRAARARDRLLREAQAMARLAHPNVVTVHDVGEHDGQVFIAMEFVRGQTLLTWCRDGPERAWHEILAAYMQAGRGLAAAHHQGIIHRDFKPENALIDDEGRVRVLDFGLAAVMDGSVTEIDESDETVESSSGARRLHISNLKITPDGVLTGTPAYMSPEQHLRQNADEKSDQFSFCVALYEALYRVRPFAGRGLGEIRRAILTQRLTEPPPDTRVPNWVRRALERGLCVDPVDRFETMEALLAALDPAPRRSRRRRLAFAGAGVVALIGALLYRRALIERYQREVEEAGTRNLCTGAEEQVRAVWNDERRAALSGALLATDLPYASGVWDRVEAHLDSYTTSWARMHTRACEATHVDGSQSPELLDLRVACLERHLSEVAALLEVFASADATVVENAVQAAQGLPRVERCADTRALLERVAPPEDEELAARVEQLRGQLSEVEARTRSGRLREAMSRAEAVLTQVERVGYRPLHGATLLSLGDAAEAMGEVDRAAEAISEAYWDFLAIRDDAAAARSASVMVHVETTRGHGAAAERWARDAAALLDRIELDNPKAALEHRAGLANHIATKFAHDGQLADAIKAYREALEGFGSALGESHYFVAGVHNNLGNVLTRAGHSVDGQAQFEQALKIYERELGPRHPTLAAPLNNLAELYRERGEYEAARATYRRAMDILSASVGTRHPNVGVIHNNLGEVASLDGDYAAAREQYRAALEIFEHALGADSPHMAYPLTGLGTALLEQGDAKTALSTLERAMRLRDGEGVAPLNRATTQFQLARALWAVHGATAASERVRARALAEAALTGFEAAGSSGASHREKVRTWLDEHSVGGGARR